MDAAALDQALAIADDGTNVREAAAALRAAFAGLRIVVVDAHDMRNETPAAVGQRRQLFLGASNGHCWTVTADPTQAAGLFIADRG
jgi:hypothetical protein